MHAMRMEKNKSLGQILAYHEDLVKSVFTGNEMARDTGNWSERPTK